MADNHGFTSEGEGTATVNPTLDKKNTDTRIVIEDETQTQQQGCCSWSRMCDVLGNRQGTFIMALRPLRNHLIKTEQVLRSFQLELERGIKTKKSSGEAARATRIAVHQINKILMNVELNIPPQEGEMLRHVSYEIAVLGRVIEEVAATAPEVPRSRSHSALSHGSVRFTAGSSANLEKPKERTSAPELRFPDEGTNPAVDEHSLKERITRCCNTVEQLIMFIDKKTERRWWLRDVINFLQLFIKLALFVSAAISVAYHEEQVAPIITLSIAIIQGVVEMLDQYFLKHTKPEEIKLSVVTTLTAVNSKT